MSAAPSSFIANAHNELCLAYGKNGSLRKKLKILSQIGGGAPHGHIPPLNVPLFATGIRRMEIFEAHARLTDSTNHCLNETLPA